MQLVDDTKGHTVYTLSSLSKEFKEKKLKGSKDMEAARALAEMFAQKVKEKDVTRVVFDRSGYRYHGKVKAMAEALRGQGLLG
jgi:large subunit ribosomal protein L18